MQSQAWSDGGHVYTHRERQVFVRDDGAGESIVAIHGFPTSSWDWHRVWPGLTAKYRVIAPDMMGFGLSDKPVEYPYSLMDQADLVEGVLKVRGVTVAHVLAHDYGDTVAQELLARHAEGRLSFTLRSVCLLNGGIIPAVHRPRVMQRLLLSPLGRFIGPLMSEGSFRKSFAPIFGPETPPSEEELRGYWHFIQHNHGTHVVHRLIHYMTERRTHEKRWIGVLARPGVPLALIFGALDPISGRHMSDAFRALNPEAPVHVLERIGHYPQMEAAAEVLDLYLAFLNTM